MKITTATAIPKAILDQQTGAPFLTRMNDLHSNFKLNGNMDFSDGRQSSVNLLFTTFTSM
jgi:hypothetical protein